MAGTGLGLLAGNFRRFPDSKLSVVSRSLGWLLWTVLSAFYWRAESHMQLLCSGTEGSRDANGRRSILIRETFTNGLGKACAKDVHLQGQEMGKKEVGVRALVKKRKESDWFKVKFPKRNLEDAPHPKETHTLF